MTAAASGAEVLLQLPFQCIGINKDSRLQAKRAVQTVGSKFLEYGGQSCRASRRRNNSVPSKGEHGLPSGKLDFRKLIVVMGWLSRNATVAGFELRRGWRWNLIGNLALLNGSKSVFIQA